MNQVHYIISDAAKLLHVEAHVLRYWEEELSLKIPRNKMGHRIYGQKEIELFKQIMRWKEQGLSLKEIQEKCVQAGVSFISESPVTVPAAPVDTTLSNANAGQVIQYPQQEHVAAADEKMQQFKQILGRIVSDAIRENATELTTDIASHVSNHVNKELDFLFREKEEADEKRFRNLDETIRNFQKARQEAAAAQIKESKSKSRHKFRKK